MGKNFMLLFNKVNGRIFGSRKVIKMTSAVGGVNYGFSNYNRVTHSRQNTIQKIATGQNYPNAASGASELAYIARLTSNIGATSQSISNNQNISSAINIAAGATKNTIDGISTLRKHVINAMNDSNGSFDRQAIQKEINHIVSQINSNAYVEYNGKRLLDGSRSGLTFAGIDGYEEFQAGDIRTSTLGLTDDQGNVTIDVSTMEASAASLKIIDRAAALVGDIYDGVHLLGDYVSGDAESALDVATTLGAQSQRLEMQNANYEVMKANQEGTLSAINDTDIAVQFSELHTQQVLEQLALFGMKLFNLHHRQNIDPLFP